MRLVAPRRFGKTSLLLAHASLLRATGWRAVHVDLSRVTDMTDVARRIAEGYAGGRAEPGFTPDRTHVTPSATADASNGVPAYGSGRVAELT